MSRADQTPPPRPALPVLQHHQAELIETSRVEESTVDLDLRGGFDTRRDVINWYQRAIVRSFGSIADEWDPADLVRDTVLLSHLLNTGVGETSAPAAEPAKLYRRRLEAEIVLPAFNAAYNELRKMAGEYLAADEQTNPVDPESVVEASGDQSVALRPGFSRKDEEQHLALQQLWGGFPDEESLLDWLHELDEPTNGAIESELPAMIRSDPIAKRHLLTDRTTREKARAYRERFAVLELLPAFVDGISRMDTGELAKQTSGDIPVKQG